VLTGRLLRWSGHIQAPCDYLTQLGNESTSLSRGTCGQIMDSVRWVMMPPPLNPVDKG